MSVANGVAGASLSLDLVPDVLAVKDGAGNVLFELDLVEAYRDWSDLWAKAEEAAQAKDPPGLADWWAHLEDVRAWLGERGYPNDFPVGAIDRLRGEVGIAFFASRRRQHERLNAARGLPPPSPA